MQDTYYTRGFLRKSSAPACCRYLKIQNTAGEMIATRFVQSQPGWDDIRIPLSSTGRPSTNPAQLITFYNNVMAWKFSGTTNESVMFELQLPHGLNTDYPGRLHIHWSNINGLVTGVVWRVEITRAIIGGTFGAPAPYASAAQDITGPYAHMLAEIAELTNLHESEVIVGRLYRDSAVGSDENVFGLSLDLHYVRESLGSINETGD